MLFPGKFSFVAGRYRIEMRFWGKNGLLVEKLYLMLVVWPRILFNFRSFVAKVNVTVKCDLAFVEVV